MKANGPSAASSVPTVFYVSQSSDTYYVLYQPAGPSPYAATVGKTYLASGDVIAIPKTDVEHVTLLLPNDQVPMPATH